MSAGGADTCQGCGYRSKSAKLAKHVARLRKLVEALRFCHAEGLCEDCDFGPYHSRCHASRLSLINEVLKATAPKKDGK
jgi:hypothetical protein